jgi:K+-transporting ATPase ATPase A chain
MNTAAIMQVVLYLLTILILSKPLGWYMAQVYQHKPCGLDWLIAPVERFIYRICNVHPENEMSWKGYLTAMLIFNFMGVLVVYGIQRVQFYLPLNFQDFPSISPALAFNTAASYVTNTNWQAYDPESTMTYLTQMLAFTVQNFLSAATGMALLMALIRGLIRHESDKLGNFWVDMTRGVIYILLPLSFIFAIFLSSQGVIQNFKPYQTVSTLQGEAKQVLPMGPMASQIAIKQLGSNGGGYLNTNAAHPFENPTPLTNILEMLALLLIPAALCLTYGMMINDQRQGWALLITMMLFFIPAACLTITAEQNGNPAFTQLGVDQTPQRDLFSGGNMEGKETRFGIVNSSLWATATTASSNGSVNAMLDSFTPMGGLVPLWLMHMGEIIFGGVGSGLYVMLLLVIITVFVAGLMVGRTPEYLGKKIEPFEMKMVSIAVLVMPLTVLTFTAIATVTTMGTHSILNKGAHGFAEILYAFTSMVTNNGSAFAGLNANTFFYNLTGGIAMLMGRFWLMISVLAIAGSLGKKKVIPPGPGTLPTHTPLFIFLLMGVILILGALSFFPALSLGPIAEHLMFLESYGH